MSADPAGWPAGVGRRVLDEVDSTNAEAQRLAPHLTGPAWIMARRQTAGRGRRGRAWASPPGNLAASLVMRPAGPPAAAAQRSFVAALALADALQSVTGPGPLVTLKWPNDVLLNGGKVAGILLESAGRGGRTEVLVIGFGVNLAEAPPAEDLEPGAMRPVSLRGETGHSIAPDDFLTALAAAFARREAEMAQAGFGAIRAAWLTRAARLGMPVTARMMNDTAEGIFETIDDDGALVLAMPAGRRKIPAADIFF